jgi:regulator of replication initiation timing
MGDYSDDLEQQLAELSRENMLLEAENKRLREALEYASVAVDRMVSPRVDRTSFSYGIQSVIHAALASKEQT